MIESKLGDAYYKRAMRARAAKDLDRAMANAELALPLFREAARIYWITNRASEADRLERNVLSIEAVLGQLAIARAATATKG